MMRFMLLVGAIVAAAVSGSDSARAQDHRRVGVLTCRLAPSVGLIIGSRQRMDCRFNPSQGGRPERYEVSPASGLTLESLLVAS
jgi:hypothetical protein